MLLLNFNYLKFRINDNDRIQNLYFFFSRANLKWQIISIMLSMSDAFFNNKCFMNHQFQTKYLNFWKQAAADYPLTTTIENKFKRPRHSNSDPDDSITTRI